MNILFKYVLFCGTTKRGKKEKVHDFFKSPSVTAAIDVINQPQTANNMWKTQAVCTSI